MLTAEDLANNLPCFQEMVRAIIDFLKFLFHPTAHPSACVGGFYLKKTFSTSSKPLPELKPKVFTWIIEGGFWQVTLFLFLLHFPSFVPCSYRAVREGLQNASGYAISVLKIPINYLLIKIQSVRGLYKLLKMPIHIYWISTISRALCYSKWEKNPILLLIKSLHTFILSTGNYPNWSQHY